MMIRCSVHVADGESVHQFFQLFHLCDDQKQIVRIECFKHKKAGLTAGERRAR